jgi:NDP-sugar pyrophosphorylase family protein
MLNIVLPLAGRGQRFADAGYTDPKPLIPVHGLPMIELVIRNLSPRQPHRFIFIARSEHLENKTICSLLQQASPHAVIIPVSHVTEGPACSAMLARQYINNNEPLMIANCDQWVDVDIDDYINSALAPGVDGLIMTMKADHPKWSYAKSDADGVVTQTAEKIAISEDATVGIYNFTEGATFVQAAEEMVAKNLRVNNEFYVAPVYNEIIARGKKIRIYGVGSEFHGMYGLGTPEDLEKFISLPISKRAAGLATPSGELG